MISKNLHFTKEPYEKLEKGKIIMLTGDFHYVKKKKTVIVIMLIIIHINGF